MLSPQTLTLAARLVETRQRRDAARALAAHLGAEDMMVFIEDPETRVFLPAPGFPQTLPRARRWHAFLAACVRAGAHMDKVPFPDAATMTTATGIAQDRSAIVLLDGAPCAADMSAASLLLPLLAAAFRGEQAAHAAAAQAALARQAAAEAEILARSLDSARIELQEALHARDEFLLSITHDLKTPLAAIKGLAQMLHRQIERSHLPDAAKLADRLALIDQAATKMTAMINELIDLARLQIGEPFDLDLHQVDLVALVRQLIIEHQQSSRHHRFHIEAAASELTGIWDATRLERAIGNVLINAIKYSPEDTDITIRLARETEEEHSWAVLTIQDQGIGIPASDLPHIFDRFHRARNVAGHIAGTGIGLASARQIIERHGGTITATSTEGTGSTFTIRLPLRESWH